MTTAYLQVNGLNENLSRIGYALLPLFLINLGLIDFSASLICGQVVIGHLNPVPCRGVLDTPHPRYQVFRHHVN